MASLGFTARRSAFGLAIALAAFVAPAVAVAPMAAADPGCTSSTEPGNASLNCGPEAVGGLGAPSEMDLTDINEGAASPASPVHGQGR
ncbi:MAG TPA: hypothetical protein VH496_04935 [Mycobacterium sp.]